MDQHLDHFAEFYGWYENDGYVFLSMEYFPHGDLASCIHGPVLEPEAQEIVRQLLAGLQIIHGYGITHRDLEPQNIFVVEKSPNWWVKIGDFGISKRIGEDGTYLHTTVGTERFMAPEVLDEDNLGGYTNAVDIWALGCVLYLLLAWTTPFPNRKSVRRYAEGEIELPIQALRDQGTTLAAVSFTKTLLAARPDDRPSATGSIQLPWISNEVDHAPVPAGGRGEPTSTDSERTSESFDDEAICEATQRLRCKGFDVNNFRVQCPCSAVVGSKGGRRSGNMAVTMTSGVFLLC